MASTTGNLGRGGAVPTHRRQVPWIGKSSDIQSKGTEEVINVSWIMRN